MQPSGKRQRYGCNRCRQIFPSPLSFISHSCCAEVRGKYKAAGAGGRETAERETAGQETARRETAGRETAGLETARRETAGRETAGRETAGRETAGRETAGRETAGRATWRRQPNTHQRKAGEAMETKEIKTNEEEEATVMKEIKREEEATVMKEIKIEEEETTVMKDIKTEEEEEDFADQPDTGMDQPDTGMDQTDTGMDQTDTGTDRQQCEKSVRTSLPSTQKPRHSEFHCLHCKAAYKSRASLLYHMKHDCGSSHPLWKCSVCLENFTSLQLRKYHMEVHRNLPCPHCRKLFWNKRNVREHSAACSARRNPPPPRRYVCESCGAAFVRNSNLRDHQYKVHPPAAAQCAKCGKILKCAASLRSHMRTHARRPLYRCDSCEKDFLSKSYFLKHLISHRTASS